MSNAIVASKEETISLYFKGGGSDKIYQIQLLEKEPGYVVNFQYGRRRGSTLQAGTKTANPVSYAMAKKLFDKLAHEKMSKGYSPGEDGVSYQDTVFEERSTGIVPQLLNPIDDSELESYLEDDNFVLQQKHDGERRLLKHMGSSIIGINRKGLRVALPESLTLISLGIESFVMDGEIIGEDYYAFDLLEWADEDLTGLEYWDRHARLKRLVERIALPNILLVTSFEGAADKFSAFNRYKLTRAEGVVFKNLSAFYLPGRPSSGGSQLKYKFTESASVFVYDINQGKRSVAIAVLQGDQTVAIGNVTIPPNFDIPKIGDLVEVRYLFAFPGGSLFQPVYLGKREDIELSACNISQLKFKTGTNDNPEE